MFLISFYVLGEIRYPTARIYIHEPPGRRPRRRRGPRRTVVRANSPNTTGKVQVPATAKTLALSLRSVDRLSRLESPVSRAHSALTSAVPSPESGPRPDFRPGSQCSGHVTVTRRHHGPSTVHGLYLATPRSTAGSAHSRTSPPQPASAQPHHASPTSDDAFHPASCCTPGRGAASASWPTPATCTPLATGSDPSTGKMAKASASHAAPA